MAELINAKRVKELRDITGAGMMSCKKALIEAGNDFEKAVKKLQMNYELIAEKKLNKSVNEGVIESYIHTGNTLGVLIELNCETDFVSKKSEFKKLAKDIAMQIASYPEVKVAYSSDVSKKISDNDAKLVILLKQNYIKDPSVTVAQLIQKHVALFGENIKIAQFIRYKLGESLTE